MQPPPEKKGPVHLYCNKENIFLNIKIYATRKPRPVLTGNEAEARFFVEHVAKYLVYPSQ